MIYRLKKVRKKIFYKYLFLVLQKLKLIEDRLNQIENKIKEIEAKIANLEKKIEILEAKCKNQNQEIKVEKKVIQDNTNKDELEKLKQDLEKLKKELEDLKNAHGETVIKVTNNKEQIDLILGRLNDIIKGYKEGDDKLQKEIDDLKKKLAQINSQIDLLLKMPRGTGDGKIDMSALNELMKKILDLENELRTFIEKVNIDEIYRQLKYLHDTKADKSDLEDINKKIDDLYDKHEEHSLEIAELRKRIDNLFSQFLNRNEKSDDHPTINVDFSQYVSKIDFEKHKKENEQEFRKVWEEIEKLKELINKILLSLKDKANLSDLEDLKNFLIEKLNEFAIACNKKFADKNETTNNFKYLEDQIKKILEMLSKKDTINEADNWLLAKKPINGYSCAACESFIGDLRDDAHKFIPWNRMPLREPGDKLYRMGNGFSKMLQMLNFDNNGNVSLNPNIMNEATLNSNDSRVASAFPGQSNNLNNTNNNTSRQPLKTRVKSANPKIKIKQTKETNNEITKKNNVFPDIYDGTGKNEEGPKITKVIKKGSFRRSSKENGGS
jgi:chromosome segregation ATPase